MGRLFAFFFIISLNGFSQDLEKLLVNSEEVDSYRYDGVKGSAYYFEEFVKGKIVTSSAETFTDMTLNYNAETQTFEIMNDGKVIELYKPICMRVEVMPEDNPGLNLEFPIVFQRGFHVKWFDKFGQMVYDGSTIKLVKDYYVEMDENIVNDVGKTVRFKRFDEYENYYFLVEGELTTVRLNRKKILKELEHSSELEKFAKDNKIDLGTEVGVRRLLAYYETIN